MASAWGLSFGSAWGFSFGKTTIFTIDTHDGGDKKRKFADETEKKRKKRAEIVRLYEQLVEGKPDVAREIALPILQNPSIIELKSINFDELLADLSRIDKIYQAWIEMDDEEVLALL
jgi:hypothetical protein